MKLPDVEKAEVPEAKVSAPIEDDVIQQGDTQYRPRRLKLTGHLNISGGRLKTSSRMIVGDDDRGGAIRQCVREDLSWVHRRPVDQTNGYDPNVQDLIRTVNGRAKEMLLLAVSVVSDVGQQLGRRFDLRTVGLDSPAGKLNPCQN